MFHFACLYTLAYVYTLSFSHPRPLDHGKEHPPDHEHKQLAGGEEENGEEENTTQANPLAEVEGQDEQMDEALQQQEEVRTYLLSVTCLSTCLVCYVGTLVQVLLAICNCLSKLMYSSSCYSSTVCRSGSRGRDLLHH